MAKIGEKIDRLTNSIRNRVSGDSFDTDAIEVKPAALKALKGWKFDWAKASKTAGIYKLVIRCELDALPQGLIAVADKGDHLLMDLVETAPHNFGKEKVYEGVLGNLVAFACKLSFEKGYDGYVAFDAKTSLRKHYEETLGAKPGGGIRMYIDTPAAAFLVKTYYNK